MFYYNNYSKMCTLVIMNICVLGLNKYLTCCSLILSTYVILFVLKIGYLLIYYYKNVYHTNEHEYEFILKHIVVFCYLVDILLYAPTLIICK